MTNETIYNLLLWSGNLINLRCQITTEQAQQIIQLINSSDNELLPPDEIDLCQTFAATLRQALADRAWFLAPHSGDDDQSALPINAVKVGWQDDVYIYLLPQTVKDIIDICNNREASFSIGRNMLYNLLQQRGWLHKIGSEYIPNMNYSPHVLKILRSAIYPDEAKQL